MTLTQLLALKDKQLIQESTTGLKWQVLNFAERRITNISELTLAHSNKGQVTVKVVPATALLSSRWQVIQKSIPRSPTDLRKVKL